MDEDGCLGERLSSANKFRPDEDAVAVLRRRSAALAEPFAEGPALEEEGVPPCLDLMFLRIFRACIEKPICRDL